MREGKIREYASQKGTSKLVLTVGVIDGDNMDFSVYGPKGKEFPKTEHRYEIGSLTKQIMESLLAKAISEKKVSIDDKIDKYIKMEGAEHIPTIRELVTHTARYGNSYPKAVARREMKNALLSRENPYTGYTNENLLKDVNSFKPNPKHRKWVYSNFGGAVLGRVLSEVYGKDIKNLIEEYTKEELGLENTGYTQDTDVSKCWKWNGDEEYLAVNGLVSTIGDMMKFVDENINKEPSYLGEAHKKYFNISKDKYDMGLGWIINHDTGIIWHDGSTDFSDCFIGFEKKSKKGIVILSNKANSGKINAARLGTELLSEMIKNRKHR